MRVTFSTKYISTWKSDLLFNMNIRVTRSIRFHLCLATILTIITVIALIYKKTVCNLIRICMNIFMDNIVYMLSKIIITIMESIKEIILVLLILYWLTERKEMDFLIYCWVIPQKCHEKWPIEFMTDYYSPCLSYYWLPKGPQWPSSR